MLLLEDAAVDAQVTARLAGLNLSPAAAVRAYLGPERVVVRPEPAGAPPRPSGDRKDPDHRVAAEHHVEQTLCDPARRTLSGQNGRGAERQSSTCLYSRPSFFPSDPTAKKTFHG